MRLTGMDRWGAGRWRRIGALAGLAAALAVAVGVGLVDRRTDGPRPGESLPGPTPPSGPVVFYEILDADGSSLMERRLDGQSPARRVALRTDVDHGRTWTVDPAGTIALALVPNGAEQELEAVEIASGASLWRIRTPAAPLDEARWSADGRHLAIATGGTEDVRREALVIDALTGQVRRAAVPDDAILQGFEAGGGLVLRQRLAEPTGQTTGWRFLRLDSVTGILEPVRGLPETGPASDWTEDVHPAAGIAVEAVVGRDQGTAIRLWPLRGGPTRVLATFASVDRIALDPEGRGVAISVAQAIRYVTLDGRAGDLYVGEDPIADFGWSDAGDYLVISTDRRGPNLTVVERATGRAVTLPQVSPVAQALFVRVVGGVPLPAAPLPAAEPTPTPTPGPLGADVAGAPGLLAGWIEAAGDRRTIRARRLVPTEGGGIRSAADMPPIELDAGPAEDGGEPNVILLPRPATADVLVWVEWGEGSAGWLWDGAASVAPLDLPGDWPAAAYDLAWRPDGRAIAASAGRTTPAGEFEGTFAVAEIGGASTRILPIVGEYNRLEGWWSATELRVGHGICPEGCGGRYAESARLRLSDRRLVQLTPADRARAVLDVVTFDGRTIVLSLVNEDRSDDVSIDWPAGLATGDGVDILGFAADGRSLLVAAEAADGTDVYRIDDPVGRAVGGRLADPRPTRIGHVAGRGLRLGVAPGEAWAIAIDRVDDVHLVRLADGRSWPLDRDRVMVWAGSPGR